MHSIFCVCGSLPGDSILEQFVHFFSGKENNGMVCCTSLRKEQSQHFSLESPFTRLCSILCRGITQGSSVVCTVGLRIKCKQSSEHTRVPFLSSGRGCRVLIQSAVGLFWFVYQWILNRKHLKNAEAGELPGVEAFSETSGMGRLQSLRCRRPGLHHCNI